MKPLKPSKDPAAVSLGRKGGLARVRKGFASPDVMRKALETRRLRREQKKMQEAQKNS